MIEFVQIHPEYSMKDIFHDIHKIIEPLDTKLILKVEYRPFNLGRPVFFFQLSKDEVIYTYDYKREDYKEEQRALMLKYNIKEVQLINICLELETYVRPIGMRPLNELNESFFFFDKTRSFFIKANHSSFVFDNWTEDESELKERFGWFTVV